MRNFIWLCVLFVCVGCAEKSESSAAKTACEQFMKGRIAFDKGDETLLKEFTSDSLFLVIQLNKQHSKVLRAGGATGIREDIKRIKITSVDVKEDCAICKTSYGDYYFINVCKDDGVWKVQGENNKYPTAAQILRTKNKIQKQKEFIVKKPAIDSVLKVVNAFHTAVKTYFLTENINSLPETCDAATLKAVKAIYAYTQKIDKLPALKKEIEFPKALVMDPLFDGKKVKCKFYDEETYINLEKINNNYTMTGLLNIDSDKITNKTIKDNYLDLLRALKLLRTKRYWNKMEFMSDAR